MAEFDWYDSEKFYIDPLNNDQPVKFPSVSDKPTVDLSVVVPAYNEELRLPLMMDECLEYLEARRQSQPDFTYEVIVVSDGSTDGTESVALRYSRQMTTDKVRLLSLIKNRGKGGAVRIGSLSARGKQILFADADGATRFADVEKLQEAAKGIPTGSDVVVVGSRAYLEQQSIAKRSLFRTILMFGFHFLVWLFCVRTIKDTQCGFKLLTRNAARILYRNLHVERWAFDVELLYMAEMLNIPVLEVAVKWTEIEGSKLTPFWSSITMGRDLFMIWFRHTVGIHRINRDV